MSTFNHLLTDALDAMEDALAERDSEGAFQVVTYIPPHGVERQWSVAMQSRLTHTAELDADTGYLERRERISLVVRTAYLEEAGITAPHVAGRVRLADCSEWAIDPGETSRGPVLTTLALARKVLTRQHEARRAEI